MTYAPQQLRKDEAAAAATRGDLTPWRDAATILGIRFATVARWVDRGHLPYITVEGIRYVDMAQLAELEHARRGRITSL